MRMRKMVRAIGVAVAVSAATIGVTTATSGASGDSGLIGTLATYRFVGYMGITPNPPDAGGAQAQAFVEYWNGSNWRHAVSVQWIPYGEHLLVADNYADGRTAWGVVRDMETGKTHYLRGFSAAEGRNADLNLSLPEGRWVRIRACMGTSTDYNYYGCSSEYAGRA